MLASYPLVVARPHAELVPRPWKQLPPHQSARPVQEAKMHVLQVAHCKLDIMMIIKMYQLCSFIAYALLTGLGHFPESFHMQICL